MSVRDHPLFGDVMLGLDPQTLIICLGLVLLLSPFAWLWAIHWGPLK